MPPVRPSSAIGAAVRLGRRALPPPSSSGYAATIAGVMGAQGVVQAVNLLVGLLIVRQLGLREYAIYTIAGTLVGIGAVLANMGLHYAVGYYVARATEDGARSAEVVPSASALQHVLLVLAGVAVVAVGATYRHQFAGPVELSATLAIVLVHVVLAGRLELVRSVFYALRRVRPVVAADTAIALVRSAVIVPVLLAAPWLGALPVLLGNAGAQVVGFATLRSPGPAGAPSGRVSRREVGRLLRYMAPLWPENLYYLLQGSLATLLLAWAGSHAQVAELGALARLVQIVMVFVVLNRAVVQPYVARYGSPADFRRRALRVLTVYALCAAALLLLAWAAPGLPLLILGAQYEHLAPYVFPTAVLGVANLGGALVYWLCLSSGRTAGLSLTVPFGVAIQFTYVATVGVTTVGAALGLMLLTALGELIVRLGILVWLFRRPKPPAPAVPNVG